MSILAGYNVLSACYRRRVDLRRFIDSNPRAAPPLPAPRAGNRPDEPAFLGPARTGCQRKIGRGRPPTPCHPHPVRSQGRPAGFIADTPGSRCSTLALRLLLKGPSTPSGFAANSSSLHQNQPHKEEGCAIIRTVQEGKIAPQDTGLCEPYDSETKRVGQKNRHPAARICE